MAFHEAGHLAIGHYFGRRIVGETSVDPKTLDGRSGLDPMVRQSSAAAGEIARENMLICMAGAAAECRRRGGRSAWCDGSDIDRATAEEYRRFGCDPDDFREVDALLRQPRVWAAVERIAHALSRRPRLSADETTSLLAAELSSASGSRATSSSG